MLQQTLVIIVWYQKISNNQLHGVMLEIPREKRESQNPTFLKESVHPNRNFQRDGRGGGGGLTKEKHPWGTWIFSNTTQFDMQYSWPTCLIHLVKSALIDLIAVGTLR